MIIQIKKDSHLAFGWLMVLLFAMLFARYSFGIGIPGILLTLVVITIAAIGDRNEILAVSMCCIPLHEAIDFYVTLAACLVLLLVKNLKSFKIGFPAILCMIMVVWELLHFFCKGFDLQFFLSAVILLAFLAVILGVDVSDIDYAFIVRWVAIVSCAAGFMLLLNCISNANFNVSRAISNLQRLGLLSEEEIMNGGAIHPNSLGVINVICTVALCQLQPIKKQKKLDYLLIVLLLGFGVLTSSRTFLICLLFAVLMRFSKVAI